MVSPAPQVGTGPGGAKGLRGAAPAAGVFPPAACLCYLIGYPSARDFAP